MSSDHEHPHHPSSASSNSEDDRTSMTSAYRFAPALMASRSLEDIRPSCILERFARDSRPYLPLQARVPAASQCWGLTDVVSRTMEGKDVMVDNVSKHGVLDKSFFEHDQRLPTIETLLRGSGPEPLMPDPGAASEINQQGQEQMELLGNRKEEAYWNMIARRQLSDCEMVIEGCGH